MTPKLRRLLQRKLTIPNFVDLPDEAEFSDWDIGMKYVIDENGDPIDQPIYQINHGW